MDTRVHTMLQSVYEKVSSLKEYLHDLITDCQCLQRLQQPNDKPRFTALLDTLLVCHQNDCPAPAFTSFSQQSHQNEIIVKVIESIQHRGSTKNLIVYGFGCSSRNVESQASNSTNVECTYPSSTCSLLMSRPWITLLGRVGDEVMKHLLESTSLFAFIEPACYVQLTGTPVYDTHTPKPLYESTGEERSKTQKGNVKDERRKQISSLKRKDWLVKKKELALSQLRKKQNSFVNQKVILKQTLRRRKARGSIYKEPSQSEQKAKTEKSAKHETRKRPFTEMASGSDAPQPPAKKMHLVTENITGTLNGEQSDILKRCTLYSSCQHEGPSSKNFLKVMSVEEEGVKCFLQRIFILSRAKPIGSSNHSSFRHCRDVETMEQVNKSNDKNLIANYSTNTEKDENMDLSNIGKPERGKHSERKHRREMSGEFSRQTLLQKDSEKVLVKCVTKDELYNCAPKLTDSLRIFVKLNRKCNKKALLELHCPTGTKPSVNAVLASAGHPCIPKLNAPVFIRHHRGLEQADGPPIAPSLVCTHQVNRNKKIMEKLLNSYTEDKKVVAWLRSICRRILPLTFWGTLHNQRAFFRCLRKFLIAGKFERLSPKELIYGIKVRHMACLMDFGRHADRELVLMMFLRWFMVGYCIPLLKAYFYITDSSTYRNRLFYYRKPVWSMVEKLALDGAVKAGDFESISKAKVKWFLSSGALPLCRLRFMPKESGVRPIVTLNGQASRTRAETGVSANKQLANLFHLLTYIKNEDPSLIGSSVLGQNDLYGAWRRFTDERKVAQDDRPLFFVKLDIKHCYDSIDQQLLINIVSKHINQHLEYAIRRYVKVVSDGGKMKRTFCREVVPLVDFLPDSLQFASRLQQGPLPLYSAIIIDQVHHQIVSAQSLLSKLHGHIKMNLVTINGHEYLQTHGISQGSILSPLLCAFYYGSMEKKYLIKPQASEILLRQVDDFLFVTPDRERANNFLDIMLKGIPEYRCQVNAKKTLTTFPTLYNSKVGQLPAQELFPWCGLLIDTKTLNVSADYSRYAALRCDDILTFDTSHRPGEAIFTKLTRCLKLQCQGVLVDSAFNDKQTVITNIYQMSLLMAERFIRCEQGLTTNQNVHHNLHFFVNLICRLAEVLVSLYLKKCLQVKSLASLTGNEVRWVILAAVVGTLSKRRSKYRQLEATIMHHQQELGKLITRDSVNRLKSVIRSVPLLSLL